MRARRLWPVIIGVVALLGSVGTVEWYAETYESRYEVIMISAGTVTDGAGDELAEQPWLSTAPISSSHSRARRLLRRGDLEQALALYEELAGSETVTVSLLTEYGQALRRANRCVEAFAVIGQALELSPNDPDAVLLIAQANDCLRDFRAARNAFERAVELDPNNSTPRMAYGEFLRREGDLERAVEILRPAATSGGNDSRASALAALGECLFLLGQHEEATARMEEAIRRSPATLAIWLSVARTYLQSTDPADHAAALEHAIRASRLAPEVAAPHVVLGRTYERLGQRMEAISAYRRASELDPDSAYARTRLVRLAIEEEEFSLATRSARGLLELDADEAEHHFLHGLAASRTDDLETARESYRNAIRLRRGDYEEAWFQLANLERDAGNLDEATHAYTMAIKVNDAYELAWNGLGLAHFDAGRLEAAATAFRDAIALRSDYASAWTNLGRTLAALNDYEGSAAAYERSLAIAPYNRVGRLRLAVAYRRIGRTDDSIAMYEALVRDEPRYVSAWYNMGIALTTDGRLEEARAAYETALSIDPNHRSSLKNLGLLEARLGDNAAALEHLTDALDRDPADSVLRRRIMRLARAEEDYERCTREARALLSESPEDTEAAEHLRHCVNR